MNDNRLMPISPIHILEKWPKHEWARDKYGEIDYFALDFGFHNGPICRRCGYSFCEHCNPGGYNDTSCSIDHYECPNCRRNITRLDKFCSECGQAILWKENPSN